MRILNVVWGAFPDIRLDKTGRLLGELGHTVDILCLENRATQWPWGKVISAPLPMSIVARGIHQLLFRVRRDPTAFPWRWHSALKAILAESRYDVIQWNDLPGLAQAAQIAREHGARLVFDMHENYADNMWSTERDLSSRSWLYNMNAWLAYEARAVAQADHVLVNIEEMGQRLTGMHGTPYEKITVVRNAEPPDRWERLPENSELRARFRNKCVLSFVSSCSRHRGMDTIVRSLPRVLAHRSDIAIVVVGDGSGLSEWKSLASELDVTQHIYFEGRVPFARALEYYAIADVGLIPHHKYAQTDNGIPHKYAQNLMAGLPVLVSSCHALQRLTCEIDCGVVFNAGDPASAADAILTICDLETRERLGRNGRDAAWNGLLSWKRMRDDIAAAYIKAMA